MKKIILVAVALFATAACGLGSPDDTEALPDNAVVQDASSAPTAKPSPAATKAGTIANGTWIVGKHIKAGTYRSAGAANDAFVFCHWSVQKGQEYLDSGTSNEQSDPQQVTLKNGQTFETDGCQVWARQ